MFLQGRELPEHTRLRCRVSCQLPTPEYLIQKNRPSGVWCPMYKGQEGRRSQTSETQPLPTCSSFPSALPTLSIGPSLLILCRNRLLSPAICLPSQPQPDLGYFDEQNPHHGQKASYIKMLSLSCVSSDFTWPGPQFPHLQSEGVEPTGFSVPCQLHNSTMCNTFSCNCFS